MTIKRIWSGQKSKELKPRRNSNTSKWNFKIKKTKDITNVNYFINRWMGKSLSLTDEIHGGLWWSLPVISKTEYHYMMSLPP